MTSWGFDGPSIGPLKWFHTTYASDTKIEFEDAADAADFYGMEETQFDIEMNGDLLVFGGKYYGDWTAHYVRQEDCERPVDTFRINLRMKNPLMTRHFVQYLKSKLYSRGHTCNSYKKGRHMPRNPNWNRAETLAALNIYLLLPFGQLHHNQPKIKELAGWIGRTSNSVALKLGNLSSLDPQIVASGKSGMSNYSKLDKEIWQELLANWDHVALEAAAEFEKLAIENGLAPNADVADAIELIPEGKTRMASVSVRVNQARFRKAVLAGYDATCCISGLRHEKLVIASHIVPWSEDTKNRLNPQNGLCLSALHDRAYDQGLITVMPDFKVRVSKSLADIGGDAFLADSLQRFNDHPIQLPERFRPAPAFLAAHAERFGYF